MATFTTSGIGTQSPTIFTTSGIGTQSPTYTVPAPPAMKMIYPFEFRIFDFIIKQEDEIKFHQNGDVEIKKLNGPSFLLYSEEERSRINSLQFNVLKELLEKQKFFNEKLQIEQEKYNQLQNIYGNQWISDKWLTNNNDPMVNWKVTTATTTMQAEEEKKFQLKNLWTNLTLGTSKLKEKKK